MRTCGICYSDVEDDEKSCPHCGAVRRRDYRGLASAPWFFAAGLSVLQNSIFWSTMICAGGAFALTSVLRFNWVPPKTKSKEAEDPVAE